MKQSVFFLLCCSVFIGAGSISATGDLDPDRFMPVDEIRRGMKGYGLTVFEGTTIDTFEAEILGVLEGIVPKGDLILARLSGGPLEKTGIFGGMSGSPIYIDGRLIGAAAYGWLFATDPIAGITPIGEMLDIWDREADPGRGRKNGSYGHYDPSGEEKHLIEDIPIPREFLTSNQIPLSSSDAFLRQWSAPVALSGFDDRIVELMIPFFEQVGLTPVQGGSASGDVEAPPLQPGSTVAIQLIRGDASAASVGTVTYIHGDKVLAFGHPMSRAGTLNVPMTGGIVHLVFPSRQRSFKMATPTQPVGIITQDRRPGISGIIGSTARTIPCHVDIKRRDGSFEEHYSYEIVDDRFYTPNMVGWALGNSILATERLGGLASLRVETVIDLEGYPPVTLENYYSGIMTWLKATSDAIAPLAMFVDNPFEEVRINGINVTVWSEEEPRIASINDISIRKTTVRPGESIALNITLRPHQEPSTVTHVEIPVPDDAQDGIVKVIVADAMTTGNFEKVRAPYNFQPEDLNQLIDLLQTGERNNEIVVLVYRPTHGITVEGEEFPAPPSSLISVMSSSKTKGGVGPTKGSVLSRKLVATDYFIVGSLSMDILIDHTAQ